jgi:hypothetical protein
LQRVADRPRLLGPRGGVGERELVAAEPEGPRRRSGGHRLLAEQLGDAAQQRVARRVPAAVVDRLEAVDVGDEERQRPRRPRALAQRRELGVERSVVAEAGQGVARGALAQLDDRGRHAQAGGGQRGQQLEHLDLLGRQRPGLAVGEHEQPEALPAGGEREHDERGGAGAAQRLVPGQAAARRVAHRVAGAAGRHPRAHAVELVDAQAAQQHPERPRGVTLVAAGVVQREQPRLEARQLARRRERLAHDRLGVLERGEPQRDPGEALRRRAVAGGPGGPDPAAGEVPAEALAEQRRAAVELTGRGGAERRGRLGAQHARDAAADAHRGARRGRHGGDRGHADGAARHVGDEHGRARDEGLADRPHVERQAVADLPRAADGLAAQAAALLEVGAGDEPGAREVVDDRLAGALGVLHPGELALQSATPALGRRHQRRRRRRVGRREDVGPYRGRAAEQPALAVVDLGGAQDRELLLELDPLGDDAGADLAGEGDGGAQDRPAPEVAVDPHHERARELEEVGAQLGDVLERGEARAGVVDGHHRATGQPGSEALAQDAAVAHGVLLGELDHQAGRQAVGERHQAGMAESVGIDVDEQQPPLGRRPRMGDGRPAGDLEVVAQAGRPGGGERHVRRQRDQAGRAGEAGQALVADRLPVVEADDGLVDGADGAGLEQAGELGRVAVRRRGRGRPEVHVREFGRRAGGLTRPFVQRGAAVSARTAAPGAALRPRRRAGPGGARGAGARRRP